MWLFIIPGVRYFLSNVYSCAAQCRDPPTRQTHLTLAILHQILFLTTCVFCIARYKDRESTSNASLTFVNLIQFKRTRVIMTTTTPSDSTPSDSTPSSPHDRLLPSHPYRMANNRFPSSYSVTLNPLYALRILSSILSITAFIIL